MTTFLNSTLLYFSKVKSSDLLQIRGKEVKLTKIQPEFLRQRKCGKSKQDQKLFKAK